MSCLSSATLLGRWGPPCNPTSGYPREFWSRPCSTTARTTWVNNSTHQWSCGRQNYCLELFDQQRGRTGSQDTASLETVDEKCPFVHWPTFLILLPTCLLSAIISNPIPSEKNGTKTNNDRWWFFEIVCEKSEAEFRCESRT